MIAHLSLLRKKARRFGLDDEATLVALAVARGCEHYRPFVESMGAHSPEVPLNEFSNEELAIALLLGIWRYEPVMIRVAAQLLSGNTIDLAVLARLAKMERCEDVLRYIAECAHTTEPDNDRWTRLLDLLPKRLPVRVDVLPHISRFRLETGRVNPLTPDAKRVVWLRPKCAP